MIFLKKVCLIIHCSPQTAGKGAQRCQVWFLLSEEGGVTATAACDPAWVASCFPWRVFLRQASRLLYGGAHWAEAESVCPSSPGRTPSLNFLVLSTVLGRAEATHSAASLYTRCLHASGNRSPDGPWGNSQSTGSAGLGWGWGRGGGGLSHTRPVRACDKALC